MIAGSRDVAGKFRVVVLPQKWISEPWDKIDESDTPNNWDERIPILVLPETPDTIESVLGEWLRNNLQSKRNAVRFLLPKENLANIFVDKDLIILARAVYLANKWRSQNPEYTRLHTKYQKELRDALKNRFDKFAVISNWNFQEPQKCRFYIESHRTEGSKIPEEIDRLVRENLFIPEDFENYIMQAANNNESVGKILNELQEPRPSNLDCIPWLGETLVKEKIIRLCARGKIAINLRGMEYLQRKNSESDEDAWRRLRGKLGTGRHLKETRVLLPQSIPATSGIVEKPFSLTTDQVYTPETDKLNVGNESPGESNELHSTHIFGASSSFKPLSTPATSALNLLGKVESWGIRPGTQLKEMSLKVDKLTGAQLQELLKKLPDGMTYELDIEKGED